MHKTAMTFPIAVPAALLLLFGSDATAQPTPGAKAANGALAVQVHGRVRFSLDGSLAELIGYASFLDGVDVPLFSGPPSERTAFLTFRAEPAAFDGVNNGRLIHLLPRPLTGGTLLHFYYNANPAGDFNKADTFSSGQKIGTLRLKGWRTTISPGVSFVVTTGAVLESSSDITVGNRKYNLKDFFDAASVTVQGPALASFESFLEQALGGNLSVPFGGSAIAASSAQ